MLRKLFAHDYSKVFAVMVVASALGLLASFVLSIEAIVLAKDADAVLACDVNSALSCGAVGRHETASVFGFPNAFLGVISFSIMLTVAVAGSMGTRFPKPFMYLAQAGAEMGVIFAAWMFLVSYLVIGTLCPWCLVTDIAVLGVLWALTRYNVLEDNLYLSKRWQKKAKWFVSKNYDTLVVLGVAAIAVLAIVLKFGSELF